MPAQLPTPFWNMMGPPTQATSSQSRTFKMSFLWESIRISFETIQWESEPNAAIRTCWVSLLESRLSWTAPNKLQSLLRVKLRSTKSSNEDKEQWRLSRQLRSYQGSWSVQSSATSLSTCCVTHRAYPFLEVIPCLWDLDRQPPAYWWTLMSLWRRLGICSRG